MRLDAERALVQTLDFFPPIVDDPRWFGRIAAANSLSDVFAMGGRALTAMNIVGWPKDLDIELLGEVLAGGLEKIEEAGAVLCGGHSVVDSEIKYGLSVTGLVHPDCFWRNAGAQQGDVLLLTKPLGMGTISTAIKRGAADQAVVTAAMAQMATLNRAACEAMAGIAVHGATDVTGFGFVGHALEMAEGAQLALLVTAAALPLASGALQFAEQGIKSGGCARGQAHYGARVAMADLVPAALRDMLFDAETSGGLLLAVAERDSARALRALADAGAPAHALVGQFVAHQADAPRLRVS